MGSLRSVSQLSSFFQSRKSREYHRHRVFYLTVPSLMELEVSILASIFGYFRSGFEAAHVNISAGGGRCTDPQD